MRINKGGFTLVELLVVIAIIGILSTVAVVNLDTARNKAKVATALAWAADLKTLAILCDNDGGTIVSPMSPGYVGGSSFCSISGIGDWPDELPSDYDGAGGGGVAGTYGDWQIFVWKIGNALPFVLCDANQGCRTL